MVTEESQREYNQGFLSHFICITVVVRVRPRWPLNTTGGLASRGFLEDALHSTLSYPSDYDNTQIKLLLLDVEMAQRCYCFNKMDLGE